MKLKITTSLLIALALASYVYAQEGTYCHTTISPVCHKADFQHNTNPLNELPTCGWYTSNGQALDQCVISYGFLGANGCVDETPVNCHYTTWMIIWNGELYGPNSTDVLTTPTKIDGPCQ